MSITVKKIIKFVIFSSFLLFFLIWLLSPLAIRHYLSEYLNQHNLVLSEDTSIRYNPFISHIEILDLEIIKTKTEGTGGKDTVLSLKELGVEIRPSKLIFNTLYVSKFKVDGLDVKIEKNDEVLEIAGFILPNSDEAVVDSNKDSSVLPDETESDEIKTESPYSVAMSKLTLKNSKIDLLFNGASHELKLNNIVISDLTAGITDQFVNVLIESEVNQSPLVINLNANLKRGNGDVGIDLNLSKLELSPFKHLLPENIAKLAGQVSYKGAHKINLITDSIIVDIVDVSLLMENIAVEQDGLELTLAEKSFSSKHFKLEKDAHDTITLNGDAELYLSNLIAFHQIKEQVLVSFEKLQLNSLSFNSVDKINVVNIENINLSNFAFSDDITDELSPLTQFSNFDINKVALTEQGVSIKDVTLSDLTVDAQLDANKVLVNLIDYLQPKKPAEPIEPAINSNDKKETQVNKKAEDQNEVAQQPQASSSEEFFIKLEEFRFSNNAKINFIDNSVNPIYQQAIDITTFSVGPFDNQKPDQDSVFSVVGKSNKYAYLNFSGALRPFASVPHYAMKGFFKEVSLPAISSYIKDALGYEVKSGQLDLSVDVVVEDTLIDGDTNVLLRGIELTSADDHEVNSLADKATMPFNIALDMLKDSDGNVDLDLPLTGKTDSPNFGVTGLMTLLFKQATMSAAKDYLITTFVPYANVVSIAVAAGEFALKVRINDLIFIAQEVELPFEKQAFLQQFSALMKDDDELQVKLCAISAATEIGKKQDSKLNDADINQLTELSNKRVHTFKDYMVEKEGIESSRLLLCTPQIDSSDDAEPKITFVI